MKLTGNSQQTKNFDWVLLSIISAIVVFSLLMLANASFNPFNDSGATGIAGFLERVNFHYVILQGAWYLIGLGAMMFMIFMDYRTVSKYGKIIYIVNVSILFGLLVLGKSTRGIKGWITFGNRGFQPSELCKITLIIFLGKMITGQIESKGNLPLNIYDLLPILGYFAVPLVLVVMQPDFGTAMVYVCSFAGMLFVAKIDRKLILTGLAVLAVLIPIMWFLLDDWQRQRVLGMFSGDGVDQVNASKLLIGSGGFFGKGFFREGTLASLDFLAEEHTDFIFAFLVETTGLFGGAIIIGLYTALILRLLYLARQTVDMYGTVMIVGVTCMFFAHIFENLAMTMGIMPVTGIPAPFLSYGGSNMLTNMLAIGLVQSVMVRRNRNIM